MLNSLRGRFILSHILPLLIVIPLMGIVAIYLIEQQILVPSLLSELEGNALVLSRLAARDREIWQDPAYARQLLNQAAIRNGGRLILLDPKGIMLASSDPVVGDCKVPLGRISSSRGVTAGARKTRGVTLITIST